MAARLVPLSLNDTPLPVIVLQRPVILIGRHVECDLRIDVPQLSRRHCCLAIASDRVMIRDLGSRHGLRVNGRVVEEATLRTGDEIAIGPYFYRLEEFTPPPPPSPPSTKVAPVPAPPPPQPAPSVKTEGLDDLIPLDLD